MERKIVNIDSWEQVYRDNEPEELLWYSRELDPDLREEVAKRKIEKGRFLDIGTGPGTQALELSRMGFDVVGSDISETAIKKADELNGEVKFVVDDALDSKLDGGFDYIFDRGMFHVLKPEDWKTYINNIKRLLKSNGILFLKCFSIDQPGKEGPHRFTREEIENVFSDGFDIESIKETVYQGVNKPSPKAFFVVIRMT
jgi:cyclopropane fatty-acyl-phospholipid synthase-like methyltransferase